MKKTPAFERRTPQFTTRLSLSKALLFQYRETVDGTVAFRAILLTGLGLALHQCFNFLDGTLCPANTYFALQLRLVLLLSSILLCLPNLFKAARRYSVWTLDAIVLLHIAGVCAMIYFTDGASSPYFAAVNLLLLAMCNLNGFYFWHALGVCLLSLGLYLGACFYSPAGFEVSRLWSDVGLMIATDLFTLVLMRFYSSQHFNAFVRNEELKETERKLKALYGLADEKSKTEDLSKIYHRGYFSAFLADKIASCQLAKNCFYLIIFDIDHFKQVNDTYGHAFGDQAIVTIAKTVRDMMRLNSYIGRYGGDEFMCVIDKATTEELLRRVGMISHAIRAIEFIVTGKPVHLTASFGIARFDPDKGMDDKKLIEKAETALLEAKRSASGEIQLAQ